MAMGISLDKPIVFHSTNVPDEALTIAELAVNDKFTIETDMEIQSGNNVFGFTRDPLTVEPFDQNKTYKIGDVVTHGGKIKVITVTNGKAVPFEPEDYGAWDENIDHTTWTQRYFRIRNELTTDSQIWEKQQWTYDNRWYYLFFEPYGWDCAGGWRFSAKDLTGTGTLKDKSFYLVSCLKNKTAHRFLYKHDVKATLDDWKAPSGDVLRKTIQFKNMIFRGGWIYFRTNLDIAVQYHVATIGDYGLKEVTSPADIDGFVEKRFVNGYLPFDGEQRTSCNVPETMTEAWWKFTLTGASDCLALAKVKGTHFKIECFTDDGTLFYDSNKLEIKRGKITKKLTDVKRAVLHYFSKAQVDTLVKVTLYGTNLGVGELKVGETHVMGKTNVDFKTDYSYVKKPEVDEFNKITGTKLERIRFFSGVVDLHVTEFDDISEALVEFGERSVIINGSYTGDNTETDSTRIFSSSQIVGRIKDISQQTHSDSGVISDIASYTIEIEEGI